MVEIKNVDVYGLAQSMIASGYPKITDAPKEIEETSKDLNFWLRDSKLSKVYKYLEVQKTVESYHKKTPNEVIVCEDYCKFVTRDNQGSVTGEFIVDDEDVSRVISYKWQLSSQGYIQNRNENLSLHRFIMDLDDATLVIDHKDRNRMNNRKTNLRVTLETHNNKNRSLGVNNKTGYIGVVYIAKQGKYRPQIDVDGERKYLGTYSSLEDALYNRLLAEKEYYGTFSPQKHLFEKFGIEVEEDDKNCYKRRLNLSSALKMYKRMSTLGKAGSGSGHDCALKGIAVQFDLKYSLYFIKQLDRYHFNDIVSSMSTMHKITSKGDIESSCNKYVNPEIIDIVNRYIQQYNEATDKDYRYTLFMHIVSNLPSGYEQWARFTTNFLQLKSIHKQRKNHKLVEDWQYFCNWILTLPEFKELALTPHFEGAVG